MAPTIWQLISLAIIVLWTARLARAKGMNPLAWGVGSALLMAGAWLVPWWGEGSGRNFVVFIGMGPLVFLLLFRSPLFRRGNSAATTAPARVAAACPRCAAADPGGQNYCVHCGWDLSRLYAESADNADNAAPAASPPEPAAAVLETTADIPAAAVSETAADIPAAAVTESLADIPAAAIKETAPKPAETATEETATPAAIPQKPPAGPVAAPILAQDTESEPAETTPAPPPTPAVRRSPTAANLTERGIALFGQGRVQEAIDQFTKAIALDPQYKLAWEQRAEAYGRLGRAEQQAADRRQLETI